MRMAVGIFTGQLFHVEVDEGAKVNDLKREITTQVELPYERLILVLDVLAGEDGSAERQLVEDAENSSPLADVGCTYISSSSPSILPMRLVAVLQVPSITVFHYQLG
ncbi:hypothetical protein SAY86_011931 [Trapa natans]|uniref:Ubiquitin-like domain-containing protein n=1 Tax=Trapa natans TaxID=22666 RepID=A0AAN7R8R9_TRANT|nr:hypothetical protein SAY86_011931 [Trapa natans]